jgi:RNA polymerase sigma-B factor
VAVTSTRTSARSRSVERISRARRTDDILAQLDQLGPDPDPDARRELLDALVCANMGVAQSIAARYRNRGISDDDLEQVAYLALVRVAQTYDHSTGHDFMSYAVPSIRGEVRRHFRDQGWMVRPPRRIQELQSRITAVESQLCTELGRPPSPPELAAELGESVAEVEEAMAANGCFSPTSLDQPTGTTETTSIGDQLGATEEGLDAAEARVVLAPLVRGLTPRERRLLELRFFKGCTQQEIADDIGVTQMQISRLLSGLMERMRAQLEGSRLDTDHRGRADLAS